MANHPNSPSKNVWRKEILPRVTEFQVKVNAEFFGVGKKKPTSLLFSVFLGNDVLMLYCGGFLLERGAPYSESFISCGIGMGSLKICGFLEGIVVYFPDHVNSTFNGNKYLSRHLWKAVHRYQSLFKWKEAFFL